MGLPSSGWSLRLSAELLLRAVSFMSLPSLGGTSQVIVERLAEDLL
jgi:hypothetical protein